MTTEKKTKLLKNSQDLKKLYSFFLLFSVFIGICILIGILIVYWLDRNTIKFQSPIVLRAPLWIEQKETPEARQIVLLEEKIKLMEASEAAKPKDAPIVNELLQSDLSIVKKNSIQ